MTLNRGQGGKRPPSSGFRVSLPFHTGESGAGSDNPEKEHAGAESNCRAGGNPGPGARWPAASSPNSLHVA